MSPETAAQAFDLGGNILAVRPHGSGLINDTYLVHLRNAAVDRAVLQRINPRAFPDPAAIMENFRLLQAHIDRKIAGGAGRGLIPRFYRSFEGADYFIDEAGQFWRATEFIANTETIETLRSAGQARSVGALLGRFHALTQDLDPASLKITRPGFHDTPNYLAHYDEVAAQGSKGSGDGELRQCARVIDEHRALAEVLAAPRRDGTLALRCIHGDPKLDNFLFDRASAHAVTLIDLDTVQAGLTQYDVGDCLRSLCNPAGESPENIENVRYDVELLRAALEGYLGEASKFLTEPDYRYLYSAIALIPFELGIRFLTDHLEGDVYFKTAWRGQNLHRARVQFRLLAEVEKQRELIESIFKRT